MEGATYHSWLSFETWLEQQRGRSANISGREPEDSMLNATVSPGSNLGASSDSSSDCESLRNYHDTSDSVPNVPSASPGHSSRTPLTAALARDCRMETRLVDGCARARQEMTIILAAPGMPLHKSPLVTAKQAKSLLAALYEPLIQVSVGRLTRRLEAPTILCPSEDRGTLGLWLLPNDDLSLVWQGRATQQSEVDYASLHPLGRGLGRRGACDIQRCRVEVAAWEELARFPSIRTGHSEYNDPLITIHMLRGDKSGRSFYIKPCDNIQTGAASSLDLQAFGTATGSSLHTESQRMYFWLTEQDINSAIYNLGRLKSLVKRPPTLSKRAGVSPSQILEIGAWLQQLSGPSSFHEGEVPLPPPPPPPSASSLGACMPASHPIDNIDSSTGEILTRQPPASTCRTFSLEGGNLAAASTVSATGAAVYRDRRLQAACPCQISVGATVLLLGRPVAGATSENAIADLSLSSTKRAKVVAEDAARRTVDRLGRQRVEELVCEALLQSVRTQRAQMKADRQQRKEKQRRYRLAIEAQPLIQRAVEHAALGTGSPPRRSCTLALHVEAVTAGLRTGGCDDGGRCNGRADGADVGLSSHRQGYWQGSEEEGACSAGSDEGRVLDAQGEQQQQRQECGGGRVTIGNIHSLLNAAADLESRGSSSSCTKSTAKGTARRAVSGMKVTVADLGDLLHQGSSPR